VCSQSRLTPEQLLTLAATMRTVGPLEVDRLLEAFARTTDERIGLALLDALEKSEALGGLRVDMLKPRLAKYPESVQKKAEALYLRINADAARQKEKLDTFLAAHKDGDIRRGQAVFHSPKAACAACHALGYLGGRTGPDLTRIGAIRSERDLLESILFPSASIVRSYEPVLVTTRAGKTYNGLIQRETPEEIELVTGPEQKVRLARTDIEEIQPSKVSIMPAGLDQILTPQELADLLAFLKSRK
jgi:putative heme-binding domain-containing protein